MAKTQDKPVRLTEKPKPEPSREERIAGCEAEVFAAMRKWKCQLYPVATALPVGQRPGPDILFRASFAIDIVQ